MSRTAKGKYEYWLTPEGLIQIEGWARDGLTDEQIAQNIGISRSTLSLWKEKYSDISDTLKKGKDIVDREVENALYQKAMGITKTIRKPIKVKQVDYKDGKRLRETETVIMAEEEIFVPPDTVAQIFWLKNRKPDKWKDKRDPDEGNKESNELLERLVDAVKRVE